MEFLEIINLTLIVRRRESFKQEEIFINQVWKPKMAILSMDPLGFNLGNCQFRDPLGISKLSILSMGEIRKCSLLNPKSLISRLIQNSMILLWWALTEFSIKCKTNKLYKNFGIYKIKLSLSQVVVLKN